MWYARLLDSPGWIRYIFDFGSYTTMAWRSLETLLSSVRAMSIFGLRPIKFFPTFRRKSVPMCSPPSATSHPTQGVDTLLTCCTDACAGIPGITGPFVASFVVSVKTSSKNPTV